MAFDQLIPGGLPVEGIVGPARPAGAGRHGDGTTAASRRATTSGNRPGPGIADAPPVIDAAGCAAVRDGVQTGARAGCLRRRGA